MCKQDIKLIKEYKIDCEYGIAAFIKKGFNQPNITINNLYFENVPKPIITENYA